MRPEHERPPEIYYDETEAKKYSSNSRIQQIQSEMTERALELLNLPNRPCLILDIGCGSGLSGDVIEESGHYWVGMDISSSMLEVAQARECSGDLFLQDAGQGVGYRPGSFDGAVSISCLQWLCNADRSSHVPKRRLMRFFNTLYSALAHGSRAVFQFYPENSSQIELITSSAMQAGFTGGLVVDYPNSTKRKKYFLCLFIGNQQQQNQFELPQGLSDLQHEQASSSVPMQGQRNSLQQLRREKGGKRQRKPVKDRNWVLEKKELRRRRGDNVPEDSKYTARKRRPRF